MERFAAACCGLVVMVSAYLTDGLAARPRKKEVSVIGQESWLNTQQRREETNKGIRASCHVRGLIGELEMQEGANSHM